MKHDLGDPTCFGNHLYSLKTIVVSNVGISLWAHHPNPIGPLLYHQLYSGLLESLMRSDSSRQSERF